MLIRFDYISAIRQASRVEEAAESICNLADREVEAIIDELSIYWKGESANLYLNKCRELQQELERTTRDLKTVANNIRTRSERMRLAEEMATQIAQNTGH